MITIRFKRRSFGSYGAQALAALAVDSLGGQNMRGSLAAVFFDVDGVLVDSLPQHLQICRDKAIEFGLELNVPTVEEMRRLISRGTKVSPMSEFFRVVGFPDPLIGRAVRDYDREFMQRYRPRAFPGVDEALSTLHDAGLRLGIVTSNIRSNVEPALAGVMHFFEKSCLFFYDRYPEPRSKAWCLSEGARILRLASSRCAFVGDQPADADAAQTAGLQFLGVSYGWGIEWRTGQHEFANSVREVPDRLAEPALN
jgi:phosphoglycolate phosphatase